MEYLRGLGLDAMVVVGYGQIIPQTVIDLAPLGILNVHGSLLPKYRGAAPIQWAIANGETWTGVTTMRIDAGLDTGDMLLQAGNAHRARRDRGGPGPAPGAPWGRTCSAETLAGLAAGAIVPQKQNAAEATYAPILKKEDGRIDWAWPARAIHNRVRGLQPWPGAYTSFRGQALHVWKTAVRDRAAGAGAPGMVLALRPFTVQCGEAALELVEVQLEGRKRMTGGDFVNGQRVREGELLA